MLAIDLFKQETLGVEEQNIMSLVPTPEKVQEWRTADYRAVKALVAHIRMTMRSQPDRQWFRFPVELEVVANAVAEAFRKAGWVVQVNGEPNVSVYITSPETADFMENEYGR